MTREELLVEIALIKYKLAQPDLGPLTQTNLERALIALYECLVALDSAAMPRNETTWETPIRRYTDERKAA